MVPFALSVVFLLFAVMWTSLVHAAAAAVLFLVAAAAWRGFAGRWPPDVATP
jgi:hypothetical protein